MNRDQLNKLYNRIIGRTYPQLLGEPYSIYRPNYDKTDNEPSVVASNVLTRVDPTNRKFSETPFSSPEYYSLFCNRTIIQTGDLLVFGDYNNPRIDRPVITYLHEGPIKECVGVRTAKKCHIANGRDQDTGAYNYVFKNVWYDFVDGGVTISKISNQQNSLRIPSQMCVLYTRSAKPINLRSIIIDIDPLTGNETGYYWIIKQVDLSGPLMILNLEENMGSY